MCGVSTMSGPPPETTLDRTQRTHIPGQKLKFLIEPGTQGCKSGTLATTPRRRIATDYHNNGITVENLNFRKKILIDET